MVITARSVNCSRALRSKVEVETTGLALIPLLWPDNDNLIHLDTDEFEWYHTHNSPADWYKLLNAHASFRSLYIQVVAGADNAKDNFYALARRRNHAWYQIIRNLHILWAHNDEHGFSQIFPTALFFIWDTARRMTIHQWSTTLRYAPGVDCYECTGRGKDR